MDGDFTFGVGLEHLRRDLISDAVFTWIGYPLRSSQQLLGSDMSCIATVRGFGGQGAKAETDHAFGSRSPVFSFLGCQPAVGSGEAFWEDKWPNT